MPNSKNRKAHHKTHIDYIPHEKKRRSAVPVAIGFCALIALGIAWFAAGPSVISLLIGAIVGVVIGYFGGKQMDQAFDKK